MEHSVLQGMMRIPLFEGLFFVIWGMGFLVGQNTTLTVSPSPGSNYHHLLGLSRFLPPTSCGGLAG